MGSQMKEIARRVQLRLAAFGKLGDVFKAKIPQCLKTKADNPVVTVKEGKLKGLTDTLLNGESYYMFKGIPYATPPLGDLRFRAPLPPKSWKGIRDATTHGAVCPQYNVNTMQVSEGSEDCLFLNVYSKNLVAKLPVMVFIHGGGFMSGSGDDTQYGPQFLVQHDVVLVTINYRLEVLGFLVLDTPEVPGNAGLKDQVLALKWVKENIDKFGGDPDNITLFGESAGAASVTYHILSPMSKGLFHRVIAQSGTCIQDWAIASEPKERAFRVAKVLGKETNDTNELLQFLRSVPAAKLAKMTFKTGTPDEKHRGLPVHFVPNVEKKFENVEAFITEDPINAILANKASKVPLMIGYNSGEGLLMLDGLLKKSAYLNKCPSFIPPKDIAQKVSESKLTEFGERIIKFYTGEKGFSTETAAAIVDLVTDAHFAYQTHRFIHLYSIYNTPIYMYRFEYETDLNVLKNLMGLNNMKGAAHADDLFYLFYSGLNKDAYTEHESLRQIVDSLARLWTNFARTGNPTPEASDSPKWPPFTRTNKEYLALNEVSTSRTRADQERVEFWNRLYREAGLPCITKSSL